MIDWICIKSFVRDSWLQGSVPTHFDQDCRPWFESGNIVVGWAGFFVASYNSSVLLRNGSHGQFIEISSHRHYTGSLLSLRMKRLSPQSTETQVCEVNPRPLGASVGMWKASGAMPPGIKRCMMRYVQYKPHFSTPVPFDDWDMPNMIAQDDCSTILSAYICILQMWTFPGHFLRGWWMRMQSS